MFVCLGVVFVLGVRQSAEKETGYFCGVYSGGVVDSKTIMNPSPFPR